jgi:hypothetical protein
MMAFQTNRTLSGLKLGTARQQPVKSSASQDPACSSVIGKIVDEPGRDV